MDMLEAATNLAAVCLVARERPSVLEATAATCARERRITRSSPQTFLGANFTNIGADHVLPLSHSSASTDTCVLGNCGMQLLCCKWQAAQDMEAVCMLRAVVTWGWVASPLRMDCRGTNEGLGLRFEDPRWLHLSCVQDIKSHLSGDIV